jgi:septal ring factor EnvC (AmiA/AmiB activator)
MSGGRGTFHNLLILTVAFFFAGLFPLLFLNVSNVAEGWKEQIQIRVFLHPPKSDADLQRLQKEWKGWEEVEQVRWISRDQALEELIADRFWENERDSFRSLVDAIGGNPLPDTLILIPGPPYRTTAGVLKISQRLESLPGGAEVLYDRQGIANLDLLFGTLEAVRLWGGVMIFLLLSLLVLSVTAGSPPRRPSGEEERPAASWMAGTLAGAGGALLSLVLLFGLYKVVSANIALDQLVGIPEVEWVFAPWIWAGIWIAAGGVLGALGAGVARISSFSPVWFFLAVFYVIILGISGFVGAEETLEQKIRSEEKKLEQIKKQIEEKKKASKKSARQEKNLNVELRKLQAKLQDQQKKIRNLNSRLKKAGAEIRDVRKGVEQLSSQMETRQDDLREILKRSAVLSHRQKRSYYTNVQLLDGFSRAVYVDAVLARGAGNWRKLAGEKERTEERLAKLEGTYQGLSKEQSNLLKQKESVTRENRKKKTQLSQIQKQKATYEKEIRKLEAASTRIKNLLETYEKSAASKDIGFSLQKGKLPWPMDGRLASHFGPQKHPEFGTVVERNGIEIVARKGNAIHAVYDGTVIFADWFKGYGKMLILDHGGKYYSIYAHAAEIYVKKGASVKKGEKIAEIGGEGPDGKGETLYFEIRHGGSPQNPLIWLKAK